MKIENKDVIQSYILTTAKYSYSVVEKRILYRIVESLQELTFGQKLNDHISVSINLFYDHDFTLKVSTLLNGEEDQNYGRVKDALLALNKKTITVEDGEKWQTFNIIERPEITFRSGFVKFRLSPFMARAFLNYSKGFSKFELETAFSFENIYAMRFYELLSNQKIPITYTFDKMKAMFCISDKYKKNGDFVRFVIDAVKKELDKKSPYSFEYSIIKRGKLFYAIKFFPVKIGENRDPKLERKSLQSRSSITWDLDINIIKYLKMNYNFTDKEIKNNTEVFSTASKKMDDLMFFLSDLKRKASEKKNPKGWLINALKKQISQN